MTPDEVNYIKGLARSWRTSAKAKVTEADGYLTRGYSAAKRLRLEANVLYTCADQLETLADDLQIPADQKPVEHPVRLPGEA